MLPKSSDEFLSHECRRQRPPFGLRGNPSLGPELVCGDPPVGCSQTFTKSVDPRPLKEGGLNAVVNVRCEGELC